MFATAHIRILGLKFLYTAGVIFAVFSLFGHSAPLKHLAAAVVVTGFTYGLGDLWVRPQFGRKAAAGAEGVLAGLVIWSVELVLHGFSVPLRAVLATAALTAPVSYLYHRLAGPELRPEAGPPPPP